MLRLHASEVLQALPVAERFLVNDEWVRRFRHRWGLRLKSVTSMQKKIPKELLMKVDRFRKYVINVQRLLGEDCVMVNWDQTPTWKEPQTGPFPYFQHNCIH